MADRVPWEYFVLRRHIDGMGVVNYFRGDSKDPVCAPNADESEVLKTFGQHGYDLCSVQSLRTGDIKYYLKRPSRT